ncbi:MAG: hypothetical protein Q9226_002253 [Calogaya cf. arnoldii]
MTTFDHLLSPGGQSYLPSPTKLDSRLAPRIVPELSQQDHHNRSTSVTVDDQTRDASISQVPRSSNEPDTGHTPSLNQANAPTPPPPCQPGLYRQQGCPQYRGTVDDPIPSPDYSGAPEDEPDSDRDTRTAAQEDPTLGIHTDSAQHRTQILGDPLPIYDVPSSRKAAQIKALAWTTQAAKEKFRSVYEALLARWGVSFRHTGTCILLPEDWRFSNALDLMALFTPENCPKRDASRASYSHASFGTSLVRAKVWFDLPSRTGLDLDVYLGSGDTKPMDASHLCHHDHCITHVIYEPVNINQDRRKCCRQTRILRAEKLPVPVHCSQYSPPCMMQHAALTRLETYYIQFAVLRQAHGHPPSPAISRPRRFLYPTFESVVPSAMFPSVTVDENAWISNPPTTVTNNERPEMICIYCTEDRLKTYSTIIGYWTHIVKVHQEVANDTRLAEIISSGTRWSKYWELSSHSGKRGNLTIAKLRQTRLDGFC